jgi:hypothetical protein
VIINTTHKLYVCIQNTSEGPAESSFNFDYVAKEYGPGAGYIFLSTALTTVNAVIFGGDLNIRNLTFSFNIFASLQQCDFFCWMVITVQ